MSLVIHHKPLVIGYLLLVISYLLLVSPVVALAQPVGGGLLPKCSAVAGEVDALGRAIPECNFCHFLKLVSDIIKWLWGIGFVLAALFMVWGALVIMTAGGSQERVTSGRKTITVAATGVLIIMASWLIITTFLNSLWAREFTAPWNQIVCGTK